MRPISLSKKKKIFKNKFLELYSVSADFGEFKKDYFVVVGGTRVGILLLKNKSVLLTKQYRFLIDDYSWEIPGGTVMKGETLENAAARECLEESGMKCNLLTPYFDYMMSVETTLCHTYLFYARDFQDLQNKKKFDKKETEATKWVSFQKCINMIFTGEIKDMMTIVALLTYSKQKGDNFSISDIDNKK